MSPKGENPKCVKCGCTTFRVVKIVERTNDYAVVAKGYHWWGMWEKTLDDERNKCTCRECGEPCSFEQVVGWVKECNGDKN